MPTVQLHGGHFTAQQIETVNRYFNDLAAANSDDSSIALILRHRGLIITILRRHAQLADMQGILMDDLLQACALAMIAAMPHYDADKGEESTYFTLRLFNAVQKATQVRNKTPRPHFASIDAPLSDDNSLTSTDVLPDDADTAEMGERFILTDEYTAAFRKLWNLLDPLDQWILKAMLIEGMNGEQVAQLLGVSRENIRRRKAAAIARLHMAHELDTALTTGAGIRRYMKKRPTQTILKMEQ